MLVGEAGAVSLVRQAGFDAGWGGCGCFTGNSSDIMLNNVSVCTWCKVGLHLLCVIESPYCGLSYWNTILAGGRRLFVECHPCFS